MKYRKTLLKLIPAVFVFVLLMAFSTFAAESDAEREENEADYEEYLSSLVDPDIFIDEEINLFSDGQLVLAFDPGHGGYDSGCTRQVNGKTICEKDLNLKIARACKEYLESHYDNVTVYLTHEEMSSGKKLELYDRVSIGHSYGAPCIISFHINSNGGPGTMGLIQNQNGPNGIYLNEQGRLLASKILNSLENIGLERNGYFDDGIWIRDVDEPWYWPDGTIKEYYGICRNAKEMGMMGIIIEHGGIDCDSDYYNFLSTDAQLKELGIADGKAIAEYFNLNAFPDANGDGKVTSLDYIIIRNHILGIEKITDPQLRLSADVNHDGDVTSPDYVLIKKYILDRD